MKIQNVVDTCFNNKHGKPVLFQAPNPPLMVWIACTVFGRLTSAGMIDRLFEVIGFGAIFTWAWLEIFAGDSLIRRIFGAVVMIAIVASRIGL